jgi:recombination protein RecR
MRADLPPSLRDLLRELERLPGIGPKSAMRIALFLLHQPREATERLLRVLQAVLDNVRLCRRCFNYAEGELCPICQDDTRDPTLLCVVEDPMDIALIEGINFRGRYHVLHGVIAPTEGIGPDDLRIAELLDRVKTEHPAEGDEEALRRIVEEIVAANPKAVQEFLSGNEKVVGFFVGQVMRATKGKANPQLTNQLVREVLTRCAVQQGA